MNRRTFLAAAGGAAVAGAQSGRRPNILIITTDQQFADAMSCRIGDRYLKTPHMDALAAGGMLFARAYCANPLCVPSRTSMFSGRYPSETGYQTNDTRPIDAKKFPCLGAQFHEAGYDMGYFGKWHLPWPTKAVEQHGFTTMTPKNDDEATAKNSAEFLKKKRERPFFAVASFLNPHNICQWARDEDMTEGEIGDPPAPEKCPPVRSNLEPQKGEPDIVGIMRRSYQATPMFPVGKFDEKKWRQYIWAYYRMIEIVDGRIGKVLQALKESGQENNTLVILTADHGDCQGAHRWNQKTILWEEAARVPLIVRLPGVVKPGVSQRLVQTGVDLWPTLCDFTGLRAPAGLHGMSMRSTTPRPYVVVSNKMVQGAEIDGKEWEPDGRMVRSERYKYTAWSEGKRRESLVDLQKDPGEMVNLAGDPAHAAVLKQHRQILAEFCKKTGDSFRVPA